MTTTIEITEDLIENLLDGAKLYGRCSAVAETTDGERVFLVLTDNHRRGRPRTARKEAVAAPAARDVEPA